MPEEPECTEYCGYFSREEHPKKPCIVNVYEGIGEPEAIKPGENCLHPDKRNVPTKLELSAQRQPSCTDNRTRERILKGIAG